MQSITAIALHQKIVDKENFQLIDVREPEEHEAFNLGGILIPLSDVVHNQALISRVMPVVFYCRKGIRSQIAIERLQQKFDFDNLINLIGGTEAWKKQFNPII